MIAAALAGSAVAMLLVRLGWGGLRGGAVAGWSLAAVSLLALAANAGAWGVAAGATMAMAVAIGAVLHAGWTAPVKLRRPTRTPASITLPRAPLEIARRFGVFVLVVPVAFAAAQWCAFGMQAVARTVGCCEADATVLSLFAQPLVWGGLMAWQMTRPGTAAMAVPPMVAAALGTALWAAA